MSSIVATIIERITGRRGHPWDGVVSDEGDGEGFGRRNSVVVGGDSAGRGQPDWFALCVGAWAVMFGAFVASMPLLNNRVYVLKIGLLLIAAFPAAYYIHFTKIPRWVVNWIVFAAAVVLGAVQLYYQWPEGGLRGYQGLTQSYRLLVQFFLWVMAFRAFAVRSIEDLVLTIIPAVSCIILVMVAAPGPLAIAGTVPVVLGALFLLAAEHRRYARTASPAHRWEIRNVVHNRAPRRGTAINTWQVVAVIAIVAAIFGGAGASYMQSSNSLGTRLRNTMARYIASLMMAHRIDYSPRQHIPLTGEEPPEGERLLLVVECDRGENWRQAVYQHYTGQRWSMGRTRPSRHLKADRGADGWEMDTGIVSGFRRREAIEVKQTFHAHAPFSGELPGLFCPVTVEADVRQIFSASTGSILCAGYVQPGETFEVTSLIPPSGPSPEAHPLPALKPEIRRRCLQLPAELPERITALAEEIASQPHRGGDYGLAVLIQNHLRDNYEYTLQPPRRPYRSDFVDHFLFTSKRGYCNHYASAMVIMCRCVDMPARLVTGFVPGEYNVDTETWKVRAKDAHAWVEVYIEGRGWQSFDPTPPTEQSEGEGLLAPVTETVGNIIGYISLLPAAVRGQALPVVSALVLAVICLITAYLLHRRRYEGRAHRSGYTHKQQRVLCAYEEMTGWLSRFGYRREATQPPLEFARSIPDDVGAVAEPVDTITRHYLRARFGARGPTETEVSQTQQALGALREALFQQKSLSG